MRTRFRGRPAARKPSKEKPDVAAYTHFVGPDLYDISIVINLILMLYVGVCTAAALPARLRPAGVLVAAATALVIALARGLPGSEYGDVLFSTVMAGALVIVLGRMSALIDELRATREALAHAAVAEERLRFARDLHDLLGHTLSLIVVKAEVVRRLAGAEPDVVEQARDIEQIGRQALVEIREAVTGYREGGLATELDRARRRCPSRWTRCSPGRCGRA